MRTEALRWLAAACVVVGLWLLIVGIIYRDLLAIALGLCTALLGVTQLRRAD